MVVKEGEHLLQMSVVHCADRVSQLLQSELRLGFTVCMVEEMHQLPDNAAEAVHKTFIFIFQCSNGLLFLHRDIAGLLEEAPTQGPSLLRHSQACLMLLGFPTRLDLSAIGEQRFFEMPPDMLDRMEMVGLQSGLRIDRFDGFREAW